MKKFFNQILLFSFFALIILEIKPIYLLTTEKYKEKVAGNEVYFSIKKSEKKNKCKILIIGDSVGKQLFDNFSESDTLNSLACNQAISMAGQFILLNNYFLAGNEVDTVFLIYSPFSFRNNLNEVFTYHYFIKPFYKNYNSFFSEKVVQQLDKIPYSDFYWLPNILTSNWAPNFKSNDKVDFTFLSPISIEYLQKIKTLSTKYDFKLIILPTPTKESNKNFVQKLNNQEILINGFENEFKNYFENIIYLNDSNFIDKVHLKVPQIYTEIYKKKFICNKLVVNS